MKRVLVLDDREDMLGSMQRLLESMEIEHTLVRTIREADEYFAKHANDEICAIVDNFLYGESEHGTVAAARWGSIYSKITLCILTARQLDKTDLAAAQEFDIPVFDKGSFDVGTYIQNWLAGNKKGQGQESDGRVADISDMKELLFADRARMTSYRVEVEKGDQLWSILSEPLVQQLEFDVGDESGIGDLHSAPRVILEAHALNTEGLVAEIRNRSDFAISLVESYMEVQSDLVQRMRQRKEV